MTASSASKAKLSQPSSPTTPTHTHYESFADLVPHSTPPSSSRRGFFSSSRGAGHQHERSASGPDSPSFGRRWGASGFQSLLGDGNERSEDTAEGMNGNGPTVQRNGKGKGKFEELSTLDMIQLTLGLAGAQLAWTVEMAFGTPYLLNLGLSKQATSLVWLAGPLSGLVMQPLIGALSDASHTKYRRRAYIVGSTASVVVSTLFVAYARELGEVFASLGGLGDWDPEQKLEIDSIAIFIGVFGFYVLDFSLNGLQASLRALLLDRSPPGQQNVTNAWHGRMTHIATILGYLAGYIDLGHWSALSWIGGGQFRKLAVLACMLMILCVAVTCYTQPEEHVIDRSTGSTRKFEWLQVWRNVRENIRNLPKPVRRVCYVQFCAWTAWFPFLFYSTTFVAEIYLNSAPANQPLPSTDTATRAGSRALVSYAVVAFASGTFIPWLSTIGKRRITEKFVSRSTKFGRSARKVFSFMTPRNFWTVGLFLYAVGMVATFWVRSVQGATAVIAFLGISWAIQAWVPFALVMESIREMENNPTEDDVTTPDTNSPSVPINSNVKAQQHEQPFRASLPASAPQSAANSNEANSSGRARAKAALSECDPLLPGNSPSSRQQSGTTQTEGQAGGTILGIHNLAIVAPQFFVALVAAIIFKLLAAKRENFAQDGPTDGGLMGSNDVVWVLRFGGLASAVGAVVSRWVLPTQSEIDYVENVLAWENPSEEGAATS